MSWGFIAVQWYGVNALDKYYATMLLLRDIVHRTVHNTVSSILFPLVPLFLLFPYFPLPPRNSLVMFKVRGELRRRYA